MKITNLHVENFKSIKKLELSLNEFNIMVGANASGKSNLVNVFRFIGDIMLRGIDNAIALQGGISYLTNACLKKGTPLVLAFSIDATSNAWMRHLSKSDIALGINTVDYSCTITPHKRGSGYMISSDYLKITYSCFEPEANATKEERYRSLGTTFAAIYERKGRNSLVNKSCEFSDVSKLTPEQHRVLTHDIPTTYFEIVTREDSKELMLFRLSILLPPIFSDNAFIRIFDFDPRVLKRSSALVTTRFLAEDGSNIAAILQEIVRNKENKQRLTGLLKQFLPFVDSISTENNLDRSISYKISECYSKTPFHATFLSDGTVSIIAIIIALYFEEDSHIIILEEPERNIHPKLLENILQAAKDVSTEKQIIITTHNPEFLKHADLDDIRFIHRTDQGYTDVIMPKDSTAIKTFVSNELGLEDLFLQDMLGV